MSYILKKKMKKGFTIVELVIVIAVIAVLASVLIPTFSSVVDKANESAALQEVQNAYIEALAEALGKDLTQVGEIEASGFKFTFSDSSGQNATIETPNGFNYTAEVKDGKVVLGAATGGSGTVSNAVTEVILNQSVLILEPNGTATLTATVIPDHAINKTVTWSISSGEDIVSIFGNTGDSITVTAISDGTATITATAEDETATCTVLVGAVDTVYSAEELLTALKEGKRVKLGAYIELDAGAEVPAGITSAIDLAGYTLTLVDKSVDDAKHGIPVRGSLFVTNSGTTGSIVINTPENNQSANSDSSGIDVAAGGKAQFDDVNIIGSRYWNIQNFGDLSLTNVNFTVKGGFGLSNKAGTAVVKNCTMIADGEAASQIYCTGGTMDIIGTKFTEGENFASYYTDAALYAAPLNLNYSGSNVILSNVTVETSRASSVSAGAGARVVIESGTFSGPLMCDNQSTIMIYGGTINNVAYVDINTDKISDICSSSIREYASLTKGENCWILSVDW